MSVKMRIEQDSMGQVKVPSRQLWGAQTQRAYAQFPVSGRTLPAQFIHAIALIKAAAASANEDLKLLPKTAAKAIRTAAMAVAEGSYDAHFPLDIFQTGSGTSSNMNVNEVIARLASQASKLEVHPNDHVNLGQSSNDVIPTALRIATVLRCRKELLPAISHLIKIINQRARTLQNVVKTGRTHLMDAMPLTFAQEFHAWAAQLTSSCDRLSDSLTRTCRLPLGGTAVGTGINAHPHFASKALKHINRLTKMDFVSAPNLFEGLCAHDDLVEFSGQLNTLAVALIKIANDLRWMNSGPLSGLGEIVLPALQPGSSIMPGKVNPVIPEITVMVAAQVIGYNSAITVAGQTGNFQLNVTLPLIAHNLLDGMYMLTNTMYLLADKVFASLEVCKDQVKTTLARNPILATALNPHIGYEKAAAIAKRAYREQRAVFEVALEDSGLSAEQLKKILDPNALTRGGIQE